MYDDNLTNTSIKTDGYLYSIDDMNTWTSTPMTDSPSHFAARYSWLVNKDVPVTPYGWNDVDEDYYPDAALTQTCSDRNTLLGYNECSEIHGPFNKYYFNIDAVKKVIPLYKEDNKLLPGNATYNMQLELWAMGSNCLLYTSPSPRH